MLRGSLSTLLTDTEIAFTLKTLADTDADGVLTPREIRRSLVSIIRGVALGSSENDINHDGVVNRADITDTIRAFRALLQAVCGNGTTEAGEQCDDNNTNSGDGCSNVCAIDLPQKTFVQAHDMPWASKTIQVRDDLVAFNTDGTYLSIDGGRTSERVASYPTDYYGDPYIDPVIASYQTSYIVTGYVAMCTTGSTRHKCAPGEIPNNVPRLGTVAMLGRSTSSWGLLSTPPVPNVYESRDFIADFRGTRWRIRNGIERWRGTPAQNDPWGRQPAWEAVDGIIFDRPLASVASMGTSLVAISVDGKRLYEQTEDFVWHTYVVEGISGDVRALLSEYDSLLVVAGSGGSVDRAYILPDSHVPITTITPPKSCGDGVYEPTWEIKDVPGNTFGAAWTSIIYGNGGFVATTKSAYNYVMTSLDGVTWRAQRGEHIDSLTYGNGIFVALDVDPMTSPDGITWTKRISPRNWWSSVTYGNGLFVAVPYRRWVQNSDEYRTVMTSPDGILWTARSTILPETTTDDHQWTSITYGNGLFVAVSEIGISRVMTSPDGITWTAHRADIRSTWPKVMYGNGLFIINEGNRFLTSTDGATWAEQSISNVKNISYDNGIFTEVTPTTQRTSRNGVTWTLRSKDSVVSLTYGNGLFVATTLYSILTSQDGITWTIRAHAENNAQGWANMTYGNGLFVAAGSLGDASRVLVSTSDGEQCDDGNDVDTDACRNDCMVNIST